MATKAQVDRTTHLKKAFLSAYAETGNISAACRTVDMSRSGYYEWMHTDAEFIAGFGLAEEQAIDALEREARRRGLEGVEEPVFGSSGHGGGTIEVGTIRKYSDTLLIFLLKGARPSKYRERIDITIDTRREVEKLAAEAGISVEDAQAEVDRILSEHRQVR